MERKDFNMIISKTMAQEIVDTVNDLCDHNINFIDEKGLIIASNDKSRIGSFHEIGHRAVLEQKTIAVKDEDNFRGTKSGINIPITFNGRILAVIGISGDPKKVEKYAYLAQKITGILLKEREIDSMGSQKKNRLNYVIRSLINKEPIGEEYLQETLKENHLHRDSLCQVVLVQINSRYNPNNLFMIQASITQSFANLQTNFYRYNYPNEYILIIEAEKLSQNLQILEKLASQYSHVLSIGIGTAKNIMNCHSSYLEANKALLCKPAESNFVLYSMLGYEILLSEIPETTKDMFIEKILKNLTLDEKNLLKIYFQKEMSLAKASEALFIHKNSLQYKLNHIADKCGYNPRKFSEAIMLYSALQLDH